MFKKLSKKVDDVSCRILLGQTARKRARQLQKSNPALSEKEAEQIASGEAVGSLRAEGVDATSYSEVSAWSKRFLAPIAVQPQTTSGENWNGVLKNCDFIMTAGELRDMLKMMQQEATAKGEEVYYKPEFLEVLYPFIEAPSASTAIRLLEVAPFLSSYFERCRPGGDFYEMKRFLGGT
jgi:hypothetical protein